MTNWRPSRPSLLDLPAACAALLPAFAAHWSLMLCLMLFAAPGITLILLLPLTTALPPLLRRLPR